MYAKSDKFLLPDIFNSGKFYAHLCSKGAMGCITCNNPGCDVCDVGLFKIFSSDYKGYYCKLC